MTELEHNNGYIIAFNFESKSAFDKADIFLHCSRKEKNNVICWKTFVKNIRVIAVKYW